MTQSAFHQDKELLHLLLIGVVNCHPHNPAKGLSTVIAFGALVDVATGMPMAISELTLAITSLW